MKIEKYIKPLLLAFAIVFSFNIFAHDCNADQNERRKWHEDFKIKKQEFLIKKLDLTPSQAEAFFPVYDELQKKKMEIQRKVRTQFKKIMDNPKEHTDKDYFEMASAMANAKVKEAELEAEYLKKFQPLIPAKALMNLQFAELEFNKSMMQKGPGPHQPRNNKDGKSEGNQNKTKK